MRPSLQQGCVRAPAHSNLQGIMMSSSSRILLRTGLLTYQRMAVVSQLASVENKPPFLPAMGRLYGQTSSGAGQNLIYSSCVAITTTHLSACIIILLGPCMFHTSFATQIQQWIATPGFNVANCNDIPNELCPVVNRP